MLGSGMNLVTTVIGFGMSATFIVFICARLICGRIRSVDSPAAAGLDIELRSELDQAEYTVSGLEPVLVAAIPTMKYDREAFRFKGDAQDFRVTKSTKEWEALAVPKNVSAAIYVMNLIMKIILETKVLAVPKIVTKNCS